MKSEVIEFGDRSIRKRIEAQLVEIRKAGWIVHIRRDLGDAMIITASDGECEHHEMWLDPELRYDAVRAAGQRMSDRIAAAGGKLTLAPADPDLAALSPLMQLPPEILR